ncbi:PolC-type DNA polymerase III [Mycoplasma phocoenae]|uniref:DNA polymerase III PolC-type n=1 Tax=Mycoplasma phocoenae TaxID=754517 RepID=A0A858U6I5_9MOLU|nr:PolC-type DNA polymerase III [Mycoplasma phocoenae]QJG66875.1 PolC-type DNA polymerase III [Mycoplasma phocoenae]
MKSVFEKFCEKINFKLDSDFSHFEITRSEFITQQNLLEIDLTFDHHINIDKFKSFVFATKRFPNPLKFNIKVRFSKLDAETIFDYLVFGLSIHEPELLSFVSRINKKDVELIEGNTLVLKHAIKDILESCEKNKKTLVDTLEKVGYQNIKIALQLTEKDLYKIHKEFKQAHLNAAKNIINYKQNTEVNTPVVSSGVKRKYSKDAKEILLKDVDYTYETNLVIKGQITNLEHRQIKEDFSILQFIISDFTEAKIVKQINPDSVEFKNGDFVRVFGSTEMDNYLQTNVFKAKLIEKTEKLWRNKKDNSPKKRIELALRSNMSTQDGVVSPKEYLAAAEDLGYEAIALTDTDGVQGFPEFYNAAKKSSVKPIYGATVSVISKSNDVMFDFEECELKDKKYVVFDLETSGLSPIYNDIIEFGAVIVEHGQIIETHQFFVKPRKPISTWTTNFTKITNEDLDEKGISLEQAAYKIKEILSQGIAVAHNAKFDFGFTKELFRRYNIQNAKTPTLDTLNISRLLFPDIKRFRLSAISKKFDIFYDDSKAHRADQDAKVLSGVWMKMMLKLERDLNITNTIQLNTWMNDKYYAKKFSNEARILAKNQTGLKELFKIISKASTDDYYNGLKVFIEDLNNSSNLLIGTATHKSNFWDKVMTSRTEDIEEDIQIYDYIELPPISSFKHLIARGTVNEDDLKSMYHFVIELANKYNKTLVAVSDARYIDPVEKNIHNLYFFADGVGGAKHWLHDYKDKNLENYPLLDLKTTEEMIEEFKFLNDDQLVYEIVVENTHKIAEQIENVQVIKDSLYVPTFDDSSEKLTNLVYETAKQRYGDELPNIIKKRIDTELTPIIKYGYSVIYWISHKLVKASADDGYLVGSRGSVGSSLVANLAGITEVNPLNPHYLCSNCKYLEMFDSTPEISSGWDLPNKNCPKCNNELIKDGHSIPFETFLGFNADKVPDIDLNFSGEYQATIHNYVKEIFGDTHAFRAGTISTIADKTAYGFAKKYNEAITPEGEKGFSNAYLEFLASKSTGVKRTTGQHPGGIIIIPKEYDVEDFTPINYPANDTNSAWKTTHFDFTSIHDNVLKLDLLGHDDPTAIKMLQELTNIDPKSIPKSDPNVIELFSNSNAIGIKPEQIDERTGAKGIPEFGTQFVRRMLHSYKVKKFSDLISLSGLSHGTDVWTGNAEDLIKNMNLDLSQLVCCRDDIMQALIAKGVDSLLSFKIMEKVRKGKGLTSEEEQMLVDHNVPRWYIESLKKIKYMFPKAHATAYVIMAWRIAWFKVYYPLEYYATFFTTRSNDFDIKAMSSGKSSVDDKIIELKAKGRAATVKDKAIIQSLEIAQELYARGFKIKNVSINESLASRWQIDYKNNALIPPFNVLESMGQQVADSIVEARNEHHFLSIEDLTKRTKINSRILQFMRDLGIFDELDEDNRISLF